MKGEQQGARAGRDLSHDQRRGVDLLQCACP
jgi:hypothetical protein